MIKYFSMFTGVGGLESGIKDRAECVGISEINKNSEQIYYNHHSRDIRNYGDITKIDIKQLPDFDLLLGGFPCQSFSMSGDRKGFTDRRGKMIFYVYDIMRFKMPRYVILENVTGLKTHNSGRTYRDVIRLLMYAGYYVRCVELNSCFYGSAQSRERIFFLCSRGKDFELKVPVKKDDTRRFRDIRDPKGPFKFIKVNQRVIDKIQYKNKTTFRYETIGGYNRVGTVQTMEGGGEKLVWEGKGKSDVSPWRYLTSLECERLQGFPDGYTEGVSPEKRYFAMGNAVNCFTSNYLFNDYLKGLWDLN